MLYSLLTTHYSLLTIRHDLIRRLHIADQPADISGLRRIRGDDDFFDMIAFGAVEGPELESGGPRRDVSQHRAGSAFRAAQLLNGEQRDGGEVFGHGMPALDRAPLEIFCHPLMAK